MAKTVVKIQGESEYTNALRTINFNLKEVGSSMALLTEQFNNNGKKVSDLSKLNNNYNKVIDEEKKKIKIAETAIQNYNKEKINQSKNIVRLNNDLEKEKNQLNRIGRELGKSSKEYKDQEKVVKDLSNTIKLQSQAYTKTEQTIAKHKVTINQSKLSIEKASKAIADNNKILEKAKSTTNGMSKSIDDFAEKTKKAQKDTSTFGDTLKAVLTADIIKGGFNMMLNGIKAVGGALVNLGKTSLNSYADYEQLTGGIETLFGKSQNKVMAYANNAYKTAGISANNYMETVTSFSASLLQSLGGDTEKTAEVSNMAVIDMADNANKMGSSMESIQNAYQGFAKQNYTMLDNLKLGYGGTKSEMERLLKDASAISGVKYDISNLNDVYQAIHVIQGELGITGTTMKEAEETISGSINSLKSSWSNLITGLADDNANFDQLIGNFVNSIVTAAKNIIPRISTIIDSIGKLIPELIDKLLPVVIENGTKLINSLINGIQNSLPSILGAINRLITTLLDAFIKMLPQLINMGVQMIVSLAQGLAQSLPELIPELINGLLQAIDALLDNIDLIVDAGIQLVMGLADGLIQAVPILLDKLPQIIDKLIQALAYNSPKLIDAGIQLIIKLADGLIQAIPQLLTAIPEIIGSLLKGYAKYYKNLFNVGADLLSKVCEGLKDGFSKIFNVGKNLVEGLWNGIKSAKDWVLDKIKGFGGEVLKGIKAFFGIKSPSTVFRDEVGKNLALGLGEGFSTTMKGVSSDMKSAIPTKFDTQINANVNKPNLAYGDSVESFKNLISNLSKDGYGKNTFNLNIENFYNNRSQDVEALAFEFEGYRQNVSLAKGGR